MRKVLQRMFPSEEDSGRPEDEKPSFGKQLTYGTQHILTMYGGVIAPPLIIGEAAGLSGSEMGLLITAGLFISGLATILQALGVGPFGARLPLVQGISFASVSTLASIGSEGGIQPVLGSVLVAGVIGLIVSSFFAKLIRFFPPVVTGTIITVIGLSLMPTAFDWAMGGDETAESFGSLSNIGLAGLTLLIILVISRVFQGAISRLSILVGIVIGTIVGIPWGATDFSGVGDGGIASLPPAMPFGAPAFEIGPIISMTVVIFVIMTETTSDILALGEIVGTDRSSKRVADGLRADMAATTVAPLFGTFACSAFAQNVGLVALTKIKSRYAVAMGGVVLVVLGLLPVVGGVVDAIPSPVLGGAGIVLFGSVAVSGIQTLARVDYQDNLNLVIVATALGFGVIPVAAPDFWSSFPQSVSVILGSGISSAAIVAVVLNIVFNHIRTGNKEGPSVFAAGGDERADEAESDEWTTSSEQVEAP